MKAIHLAAGQGTRLRPITDDRPKPLVELGGMSLLERNIATLRTAGVEDQVVVTGYEAERIEELGYETVHNAVYDETEMVYSLFCAADQFPERTDLIISYGDIVYEKSVVDALLRCDAPICVVVDLAWRDLWERRFEDPLEDAETLRIENGTVTEIGAEPDGYHEIDGQYTGLIKIRDDHVDRFIDAYETLDRESIHMTWFLQHLIDEGWDVAPVAVDGGWLEVDTIADLETYQALLESETTSKHISALTE
ncbi:MAG: NTP transferase domain-containing protein [archaeon]